MSVPKWLQDRLNAVANTPVVANAVANNLPLVANAAVANKSRSGDRHAKTDQRRAYMRDLMRRRRAAASRPTLSDANCQ